MSRRERQHPEVPSVAGQRPRRVADSHSETSASLVWSWEPWLPGASAVRAYGTWGDSTWLDETGECTVVAAILVVLAELFSSALTFCPNKNICM